MVSLDWAATLHGRDPEKSTRRIPRLADHAAQFGIRRLRADDLRLQAAVYLGQQARGLKWLAPDSSPRWLHMAARVLPVWAPIGRSGGVRCSRRCDSGH